MSWARARRTAEVESMDTAMQWLLRLRDESVTEEDIAAWMSWYESDDRNKQAFDEMQAFWRSAGDLATLPDGPERIRRLRGAAGHAPGPRRSGAIVALAATVLIALAAPVLWQRVVDRAGTPAIATTVSQVRERLLPDGSRVQLAAKSYVDVRYTNRERRLELQGGEAHFTVAPNRSRPFIVQAGALSVRAVGTAFNIRKSAQRIVVTVDHGVVDIASGPDTWRVQVREQFIFDPESNHIRKSAADPSRALAWREGRLEYIDEPLSAVIADINRYAKRPVAVQDPAAAQLAFTGTVFTQNVEEWLQALPGEFPVNLIANGGEALLLTSRPPEDGQTR